MNDTCKTIIYVTSTVSLFLTAAMCLGAYKTTQIHECRRIGMELSMSAIDIQAICK